jgi:hypothetical protein
MFVVMSVPVSSAHSGEAGNEAEASTKRKRGRAGQSVADTGPHSGYRGTGPE